MIRQALKFNQPIGEWNVSKVRDMRSMFYLCEDFNQPIGAWNVSNVIDMNSMFQSAASFNQPIGEWNVSKVYDMEEMFESAASFNQPIGAWNVSNVESMVSMFSGAASFNSSIGAWNVSKVTNMDFMFQSTAAFNQPIGEWNVSNAHDMSNMFRQAVEFNQPIGEWNVSNVINMNCMFEGAAAFNQPIGEWNVSKVTNMKCMFESAASFNQPIGEWNVSKVTNMESMFERNGTFNQPIGEWNVSNVINMNYMFESANSFNQPIGAWDVSKVTYMSSMFRQAVDFNQDLKKWNIQKVDSKHRKTTTDLQTYMHFEDEMFRRYYPILHKVLNEYQNETVDGEVGPVFPIQGTPEQKLESERNIQKVYDMKMNIDEPTTKTKEELKQARMIDLEKEGIDVLMVDNLKISEFIKECPGKPILFQLHGSVYMFDYNVIKQNMNFPEGQIVYGCYENNNGVNKTRPAGYEGEIESNINLDEILFDMNKIIGRRIYIPFISMKKILENAETSPTTEPIMLSIIDDRPIDKHSVIAVAQLPFYGGVGNLHCNKGHEPDIIYNVYSGLVKPPPVQPPLLVQPDKGGKRKTKKIQTKKGRKTAIRRK